MIIEFNNSETVNNEKYLPGQIENELTLQNKNLGIPLNEETIKNLEDVLESLEIKVTLKESR